MSINQELPCVKLLKAQHALEQWQRRIGVDRALAPGWEKGAGSFLANRYASAYLAEAKRVWRNSRSRSGIMSHIWFLIDSEDSLTKVVLETLVYVMGSNDLSGSDKTKRNTLGRRIGARAEYVLWLNHSAWGKKRTHIQNLKRATSNDLGMKATMARLRDKGLMKLADYKPMTDKEKTCLGTVLLEILAVSTDIIEINVEPVGLKKTSYVVKYTKKYWDFIMNWKNATKTMRSIHMPMVMPPRPWTGYGDGGYLSILTSVSRTPYERFPTLMAKAKDCVLGSLNTLQEQALQIDREQLALVQKVWETGLPVGEVPSRDSMQEPNEAEFLASGRTSTEYWKAVQKYKADKKRDVTRSRLINCLVAADRIKEFEDIYYVWFMDHRGRMYPRGGQISYAASDVFRSLITFKHKAKIKGREDAFAWIIGDAAGLPKDFDTRMQFLVDHGGSLAAMGNDPMSHISKWSTAKRPWKYIQLCREWARYLQDENYETGVVCQADQTTSGFGHVACLTRDGTLAQWSNICGDEAYDIYMGVARGTMAHIMGRCEVEADPKKRKIMGYWIEMETDRELWKKCVMPYIYGSGHSSLVNTITDWLYSETTHFLYSDGIRINDMAHVLASSIGAVLKEVAPGVRGLGLWLRYLGRELIEAGYRPQWATPNQMVVESWTVSPERQNVILDLAGRKIRVQCNDYDSTAKKKVSKGMAADYVHSMEAAFLQQFVWHWSKVCDYPIITVHDCFGTTIDGFLVMQDELRDQFGRFYSRDHVVDLHLAMERTLNKKLDPPPLVGDLDPLTIGDNPALFA